MNRDVQRRSGRGAAMVEAVILIPVLVLFWMGIGYFHQIYLQKMRAARLARAGTIAYAMAGCPDGTTAGNLITQDLATLRATDAPPESSGAGSLRDPEPGADPPISDRADEALRALQGSDSTFLNQVTHTKVGARVAYPASQRSGARSIFSGSVGSISWVSCGQKIDPGDPFPQVFPKIEGMFDDLF